MPAPCCTRWRRAMPDMPNIDIRPDHWEIVKSILQKHVPQYEVWAFGSRAKWTAKEYSDLDLAIITDEPLSLDVSARLSDAFSESDLPWRVDLVDWAATSESFRKIVERDKVVVQEGKKGLGVVGEWIETTLGEVLTLQRGFDLPETERKAGPYPIIASTGTVGTHDKAMVQGPGVVIGRSGSLGGGQFIESDFWPLNTTLWVKDFKGNDRRFCYYLLKSLDLAHFNAESGVPTLNRNHIHPLRVIVPRDPHKQRAIAHILGTLDDKIELNRKQNETLEAMARALFKAWFVDFEPVRAKMKGRWQRGQSLPGLPAHLYDLFPDRLVDSELGEIPEGWEVVQAGNIFDVAIGKTPPRKEHHWFSTDRRDVPWMSIKDLGQAGVFISEVSEYLTPAAVDRFRVRRIPDGTVVLSFKLTVGRVAITDGEMLSNEAIAHFLPRNGTFLSAAYVFCYLRQFDYESLGSTSSIATAVNSDSVKAIPVLVPSEKAHEAFLRTVWPLFLKLRELQRESRTLAQLRDTLLPKLISGELRVKDAEAFLKERGL
ncbi:hypothetical protein B4966_02420 [Rhodocyclaceae bacterium]|nr:hypothetical protein B4966_02420 [Rhodocyclaceae bacterium]